MKKIDVFYKKIILVDDEDFEKVSQYNWHQNRKNERIVLAADINGKTTSIGRFIWNNQKNNLRVATRSQQMMNSKPQGTRKYKGVNLHRSSGAFRTLLKKDGKSIHGGYWKTEKQAARAYDNLAKIHFGEFAKLNFPDD